MASSTTKWWAGAALTFAVLSVSPVSAQESQPAAVEAVRSAVKAEITANATDRSLWTYRDHDTTPEKDAVYVAVQAPQSELRRMVELGGQPVSADKREAESARLAKFVSSPDEQAKKKKDDAHDDAQAAELLHMLPEAFLWSMGEEKPDTLTLNFKPNPEFRPPDMQSRVLASMAGQLIVARHGNRIYSLRGTLTEDVKIGLGLLGKLNAGGSFDVERREVAPGHWQITETRVHIGGHALLFKNIGQQEDEIKTDWRPSTARNLRDAEEQLRSAK